MDGTQNIDKVISSFFPEQNGYRYTLFGSGHIHQTFFLELKNGFSYILQQINTRVFKNPVALCRNIHLLNEYLKQTNYPFAIADLMPTPEHNFVVKDDDHNYWRVFRYLSNTQSFDHAKTIQQAYLASKAFGTFAAKIKDFPQHLLTPGIPNFHNCLLRESQFSEAVRQASLAQLKEIKKEIHFFDQHLFCRDWKKLDLPLRLSHNDTKINNILFGDDGTTPTAIIDLDTVMPASPLFDFADMVRTYTSKAPEDAPAKEVYLRQDYFEALSQGFLEGIGDLLKPKEKSALLLSALLTVQTQAKRFLADYLNGNFYYKVEYPEHNLVRGRNQVALLKSMLAQKNDLERALKKFAG